MDQRQTELFHQIMSSLQADDQPRLAQLRQQMSPADREALLDTALGELTDRAVTEFEGGTA